MSNSNLKLARDLILKGKPVEAINLCRQLVSQNSAFARYYHQLGQALERNSNLNEAVDAYNHAIKLNPSNSWFYCDLALALAKQNQLSEAIKMCSFAINENPSFYSFYNTLGELLVQQGQIDEAISKFTKAAELNPNSSTAYVNLADALSKKEEALEEATNYYQKAININPKLAKTYVDCGKLYEKLNRLDRAKLLYEKYLQLLPDSTDELINQSFSHLKQTNINQGNGKKARRLVVAFEVYTLIYCLSILKYQESIGEIDDCDIFLVTSAYTVSKVKSCFIEIAKSWNFKNVFSVQGVLTLYTKHSINLSIAAELATSQWALDGMDAVYISNFFNPLDEIIVAAYPNAKIIAFPDGMGMIGYSKSDIYNQLDEAFLIAPIEMDEDCFKRIKSIKTFDYRFFIDVMLECESLVPNIKSCQEKIQKLFGNSENTICLLRYYHRQLGISIEEEVELCLSHILSCTKQDELILLKEHTNHSYGQAQILTEKLKERGRNVFNLNQIGYPWFHSLPIEFFAPFLNIKKAITFESSGCISLAYLCKCEVVLGFDSSLMKEFLPRYALLRLLAFQSAVNQGYNEKFEAIHYSDYGEEIEDKVRFPVTLKHE